MLFSLLSDVLSGGLSVGCPQSLGHVVFFKGSFDNKDNKIDDKAIRIGKDKH